MRSRRFLWRLTHVALTLALASFASAQKKPKLKPAEIFAVLKPGQWVHMEGIVQKDYSVVCMDIRILTGDFLDDKWSITAPARSIDRVKKEFKVLLLPVKTQAETQFECKVGAFQSFTDLKPGMLVEVDGTYLPDGVFVTTEVEDVSSEMAANPSLENQVEAMGRVGKVDSTTRTVTLMGITFKFIDKTEGEFSIK